MKHNAEQKMNPSTLNAPLIMVVAGEASGDEHAATLVQSLKKLHPNAVFFGMGGTHMRRAGVETVVDCETHAAVMGLFEVIGSLGKIIKVFKQLEAEGKKRKPDLLILVDFPDFNMRLGKKLRTVAKKTLYYISPTVWAWRSGRVNTLKKIADKMAVIFPFEEGFLRSRGVDATYVGHPFADRAPIEVSKPEFFKKIGLDPDKQTIALLPGSRKSELERHLKPMIDAFLIMQAKDPSLQAIIPVAQTLSKSAFEAECQRAKNIALIEGQANEALLTADAAVVASGTATIEAALAEIPFVVVYVMSPKTFFIAKLLIRGVRHIAMPNLVLGEKVVEELLQDAVVPERIAKEVELVMHDKVIRSRMKTKLSTVASKLALAEQGDTSASERVAQIAHELLLQANSQQP